MYIQIIISHVSSYFTHWQPGAFMPLTEHRTAQPAFPITIQVLTNVQEDFTLSFSAPLPVCALMKLTDCIWKRLGENIDHFPRLAMWDCCLLCVHLSHYKMTPAGKIKWGSIKPIQVYSNTTINNNTIFKKNNSIMNIRQEAGPQI